MSNWIKIYNDLFNCTNKVNKSNIDELYIYSYLHRFRVVSDKSTYTSIDLIHNHIPFEFIKGDPQKNKKHIKKILLTLIQNKYIDCLINDKIKNSDLLIVKFPYESANGHNQHVTYDIFDSFSDKYKYYIYCYIDCFGDKGRDISDERWMDLLGLGKTKLREIINGMDNDQIIYKISGSYYFNKDGKVRQNLNTYYTRPSKDIKELYLRYKKHIENKINPDDDEFDFSGLNNNKIENEEENIKETKIHNWYNKDVYPNVNDYYIYLTTQDQKLKQNAERRMQALSKTEFGKSKVDENMRAAKSKLNRELEEEYKKYNSIIMFDGQRIIINKDNISHINFEEVDQFGYINGETLNYADFIKIARKDIEDREQLSNEQFNLIVNEYKKIVVSGEIATTDKLMVIRKMVNI